MTEKTPISTGSDWTFELLETYNLEISKIAKEYGLDTYPNQIEVISSEQMMDAYASGRVDAVEAFYTRFDSALTQTPVSFELLPVERVGGLALGGVGGEPHGLLAVEERLVGTGGEDVL